MAPTPMTATNTSRPATDDDNRQYRELAQAIANQAQALADGTTVGPRHAQVRKIRANVDMLLAWTEDDRATRESLRQLSEQRNQDGGAR